MGIAIFHSISYLHWAPFHVCVCFTLRLPHNQLKQKTDGLCSTNILPMDWASIISQSRWQKSKLKTKQKQFFFNISRSLCALFVTTRPQHPNLSHSSRQRQFWEWKITQVCMSKCVNIPGRTEGFLQGTDCKEMENPRMDVECAGDKNKGMVKWQKRARSTKLRITLTKIHVPTPHSSPYIWIRNFFWKLIYT